MQGGGYLAMKDMMPPPLGSNKQDAANQDETICSEMSLADELASDEACAEKERCSYWEYHIAYHPSYQVPVLYMNGFSPGEHLLSS